MRLPGTTSTSRFSVFDRYTNAKLQGGEFTVVQRWLDALPAAWYAAYPAFDLARAGLLAFTGAIDACVRCIDDVEQRLVRAEGDDARRQLAKVTAIRCAIACMQNDLTQAKVYADRALRDLPEEDLGFRPLIYGALGDSYRQHGRWGEAKAWYLKALGFPDAPRFPRRVRACVWRPRRSRAEARSSQRRGQPLEQGAGGYSGSGELGPHPAAGHRLGLSACGRASVRAQRAVRGLGPPVAWVGTCRARRRRAGDDRRISDRGSLEADRRRRRGSGRVPGAGASAAGAGAVSGLD